KSPPRWTTRAVERAPPAATTRAAETSRSCPFSLLGCAELPIPFLRAAIRLGCRVGRQCSVRPLSHRTQRVVRRDRWARRFGPAQWLRLGDADWLHNSATSAAPADEEQGSARDHDHPGPDPGADHHALSTDPTGAVDDRPGLGSVRDRLINVAGVERGPRGVQLSVRLAAEET